MLLFVFPWASIVQSLLCGIISSFVFLFIILFLLRPSIKISPYISKQTDNKGTYYQFKILNTSFFSVFNVQCELVAMARIAAEGSNMNVKFNPIELQNSFTDHLPRYMSKKKSAPYALHAYRFRTYSTEIHKLLEDSGRSLQFSVTARHGLSGLSKHFKQEFATPTVLKETSFKFGNSLECY
jgi:hypothetical protein